MKFMFVLFCLTILTSELLFGLFLLLLNKMKAITTITQQQSNKAPKTTPTINAKLLELEEFTEFRVPAPVGSVFPT